MRKEREGGVSGSGLLLNNEEGGGGRADKDFLSAPSQTRTPKNAPDLLFARSAVDWTTIRGGWSTGKRGGRSLGKGKIIQGFQKQINRRLEWVRQKEGMVIGADMRSSL